VALPLTGGPGLAWLTWLGLALLMTAAGLILLQRRRPTTGAEYTGRHRAPHNLGSALARTVK